MEQAKRILLLAGSAEARQIAVALQAQGTSVQAIKSEPPRGPDPMPMPFEVWEEISQEKLGEAMQGVDAVIDASHGFDGVMTEAGFAAASAQGLPIVTLSRPPWSTAEHPRWRSAQDVATAMALVRPGARVFAATGWASLPDCARFPGSRLLLRQTVRHDRPPPYEFVELVFGDPPFTAESEAALFRDLNVDTLVCRNLGGRASRPKLDAAKALDLDVILIDRPAKPSGMAECTSVEDVLAWVAGL